MQVKLFEVRDAATFIPCIGICLDLGSPLERLADLAHRLVGSQVRLEEELAAEAFLLKRTGYAVPRAPGEKPFILFTRLAGDGTAAHYDPFAWNTRTLHTAHRYVTEQWDRLRSGDVVDVEFILGVRNEAKASERFR